MNAKQSEPAAKDGAHTPSDIILDSPDRLFGKWQATARHADGAPYFIAFGATRADAEDNRANILSSLNSHATLKEQKAGLREALENAEAVVTGAIGYGDYLPRDFVIRAKEVKLQASAALAGQPPQSSGVNAGQGGAS